MNFRTPILCLLFSLSLNGGTVLAADADKVQDLLDQAVAQFQKNDFDVAFATLQEANKLSPNSTFILNLLGATLTKKKDYAGAKAYFDQALQIDYSFFPAQFNVGELLFLQKQYPQALSYFTRLLHESPDNELLQFKVVLCLLQTDQTADAQKMADRMIYPGQEPAWYFAHAAVAFKKGDKKAAANYIAGGDALYQAKTALYHETFGDLGWPN